MSPKSPTTPTYILGIESSCDDTSAAVLRDGILLSNVTASQAVHEAYGGVVPELASRAHQQNIVPVVDAALKRAGIEREQLSAIAFTRGPGLLGSLLVGVSFAKGLAASLGIPMMDVNHLHGHVLAHFIKEEQGAGGKEQGAGSKEQGAGGKGQGASFPYDAIVSNPPYVCRNETAEMEENVRAYEPHLALFVPDDDPLLFYRAIADYGLVHLSAGGWLLFETNRAYARQVAEMLRQKGYTGAVMKKDQFGNDRFVVCRKGASGEAQTECRNRRHVE